MNQEEKLLSVFDELKQALMNCDESSLDRIISDDYQGFSLNGTLENKELILQSFKPGQVRLTEYSVEDIHCEISSDLGLITGKGRIKGNAGGYEFQHEVLFTDIFKYRNKAWQYYKSQLTEIRPA